MKLLSLFFITFLYMCYPATAQNTQPQVNVGILDDETYLNPTPENTGGGGENGQSASQGVINPYDPKYRPAQFPPESGDSRKIFSRSGYYMSFVRPADSLPNEATLRLMQNIVVHGCATVVTPEPDIKIFGSVLNIKTGEPSVTITKTTDAPHYDCPQQAKTTFMDIKLTRAYINNNGIRQIVLRDAFGQDRYEIDITKNYIELISKKAVSLFKANENIGMTSPLKYWFYPNNVVILTANSAKDLTADIDTFAERNNLERLENSLSGFVQPRKRNTFYYLDKNGSFAGNLLNNQTVQVGTTPVSQAVYSALGEATGQKQVQILAKRPGFYE